ncbi:MAG: FAD-dependent oxidoreductase [Candidatus Muiribacterium halophilum]|uniref:FAD-dependent oxidoreductase n=1 Tax=Muiribacterium halophilum TaxID=2053465 RepID=A0A2N5ZDF1_MUIH1|nr:MAG: FAD-dependent oxidoreductase [Candidatus Muirbacterium halophilum]
MNKKASVVIIGGGINGCALAYELAKKGVKDVMVIEKNFLASGSTGRCGGGFRQQWSTPMNIKFAMESVDIFSRLDEELQYKTEYYQGGYLILAYTPEEIRQFEKNVRLQREMGLDVRLIEPKECLKIVPDLNIDGVLGATYCKSDGHANPFYVTQAYAKKAKEMGVQFLLDTEVIAIDSHNDRITAVQTDKGKIMTDTVVNAAGGHAHLVSSMLGLDIPVKPYRHEILVTEPVNRIFDPMIISFHYHIYMRQELNGGILMGQGDPNEPSSFNVEGSFDFINQVCKKGMKIMPVLENISVVRQWAGLYAVTPDAQPILGPVPPFDNFIHIVGFSGHGFMLAPRVAQHITDYIVDNKLSDEIKNCSIDRFKNMDLDVDVNVV